MTDVAGVSRNSAAVFANNRFFGAAAPIGPEYTIYIYGSDISIGGQSPGVTRLSASAIGRTVVFRLPMRLLGNDDGNFTVASVIGTMDRATDVIPNTGWILARHGTSVAAATRVARDGARGVRSTPAAPSWGSPSGRRP